MCEPKQIYENLTGDKTRIEFLRCRVADAKKSLKYWQELETHETCLINGKHYRIKSNEK